MQSDKERLVELLGLARWYLIEECEKNGDECDNCIGKAYGKDCGDSLIAHYLIANNVVVQKQGEQITSK